MLDLVLETGPPSAVLHVEGGLVVLTVRSPARTVLTHAHARVCTGRMMWHRAQHHSSPV